MLHEVDSLPHDVAVDEHVWITVSDGTRLAAKIWRPVDSDRTPVPGLLEYIPYRKRDLTAIRDSIHHPYLAGHGYACVRVDIRGTGESEGVLTDEYLEQEQRDAEDVLAWLAEQPWCTGELGMFGISWGAFAALQVAARRPPNLRAIAISSFTDDRYADDFHYMGGCMLSDNLAESGTMLAYSTLPPDPALVGERWREMWRERVDASGPWMETWLHHQRRDRYWAHASVKENYADVRCPVLATSGWADGYSNAVVRLLTNLDVPRKGLIGPWSHKYPHLGVPGPAIGYLQELVRWWDHWLKGADNGVLDGPMLVTWMQDSVPPSTSYHERPGRWVGEPSWPSPHVRNVEFPLARHRIAGEGDEVRVERLTVQSPLSVGRFAGKWASYNAPPDLPYDQREEDGGSLVFETEPLEQDVEILGAPTVTLDIAADRPVAMVAVRLSDVLPDGRATRVTYGLFNLTHRDGHENPRPLTPGRRCRVNVDCNAMAQRFLAGHRIRLSVSSSYWPLAWPPPEPAQLSVWTGSSSVTLPIRKAEVEEPVPRFGEPEGATPLRTRRARPTRYGWTVSRDMVGYEAKLDIVKDSGTLVFEDHGLEVTRSAYERYVSVADDFETVSGMTEWTIGFARGDWEATTVTHQELSCTRTEFRLHARLDAYEGTKRIMSRNWESVVPRDCV